MKTGSAVIVTGKGLWSGRVGVLMTVTHRGKCYVRFGADGPDAEIKAARVRLATEAEITAAGLDGVGFND